MVKTNLLLQSCHFQALHLNTSQIVKYFNWSDFMAFISWLHKFSSRIKETLRKKSLEHIWLSIRTAALHSASHRIILSRRSAKKTIGVNLTNKKLAPSSSADTKDLSNHSHYNHFKEFSSADESYPVTSRHISKK